MDMHRSLRQHLETLWQHGEPELEVSADPTLAAFARVFLDSELFSLEATKLLRTGALTPMFDCETVSRRDIYAEPEKFVVIWTPVWLRNDPLTGFRTGRDSSFLGSTPTVAMPQDERTAALLLLVRTSFVHLSASLDGSMPVVQGAVEVDNNYRFLTLDLAATAVGTTLQEHRRQP